MSETSSNRWKVPPFGLTGHRSLWAWGVGTTSVNRRGPPWMPRAEPGVHGLNRCPVKSPEKSEKRGVHAARNAPSEDSKCWRSVELSIQSLNRWTINCLDLSRKRGFETDKKPGAMT